MASEDENDIAMIYKKGNVQASSTMNITMYTTAVNIGPLSLILKALLLFIFHLVYAFAGKPSA